MKGNDSLVLLKGSSLSLLSQVIGRGVAFVTNFIFARVLGASMLGNYYLGTTFLTIASSISALGLPMGVLRYVTEYRVKNKINEERSVIFISLFIGMVSSVIFIIVVYVSQGFIVDLFPRANVRLILKYLFWLLPISILISILKEILRGYRQFTVIIIGQSFLWSALILSTFLILSIFFKENINVRHAFLAYGIGTISIFFIYLFKVHHKVLNGIWFREIKYNVANNLIKTSLPLLFVSVSSMLLTWTDTVMLGAFLGSKEVGIYGVATRIAILISFILGAVNSVAPTLIGENYHTGDQSGLESMLRTLCSWMVYIDIPLLLIFINFPTEVMGIFGDEFKIGSAVLIVLSLCQFINVFFGPVGYLLMMSGYERALSGITVACGSVNILGNWILIPKIGILGAAISTGGALVLQNLFMASVALKQMKIKATPKVPWGIAGIVLTMVIISFVLKDYNVILRVISTGVELLIGGFLIIKCLIDDSDKKLIGNVLKQVGIN